MCGSMPCRLLCTGEDNEETEEELMAKKDFMHVEIAFCASPASLTAAAQPNEHFTKASNAYLLPSNASSADSLAEVFADSLWSFISIDKNYETFLPSET